MLAPFYKEKEEKIGLDVAPKDDGWNVGYKPKSKKQIKIICYILFSIGVLLLLYFVLQ